MPRFGRTERHLRRRAIADLSHEHNIGVLSQAVLETVIERVHVASHLALCDHGGADRLVHVLDGLLDGDDTVTARAIEPIDQGRQGRRLPGPRHARNDNQPVVVRHQSLRQTLPESPSTPTMECRWAHGVGTRTNAPARDKRWRETGRVARGGPARRNNRSSCPVRGAAGADRAGSNGRAAAPCQASSAPLPTVSSRPCTR